MQDERSMILNMLKEGKISVEEADALLEVLAEGAETEAGGFHAADAGEGAASGPDDGPSRDQSQGRGAGHGNHSPGGAKDDGTRDSGRHHGRPSGFKIDLDFGGLKESLRETMKGVSESVKEVMSELSDLDIGVEIFRAMGKSRAETTIETSEDAGDASRLVLTNKWGDVRLTGGDSDRVTVRVNVAAWGGEVKDAQEAIDQIAVRLERNGDAWEVKTGIEERPLGRVRLDYDITVPRSFGVTVSTASGDIWIEEVTGEQQISSLSGDITVADLGSDPVFRHVMKTRSGDLIGGALTGDLTMQSLSGDVEINGFTGHLRVTSQSGNITIHDGDGSVQLKTMSGDIDATLKSLGLEPVSVTSVSGDVELRVPEHSAVDVSARSASGDVEVDLEMEITKDTEHAVSGVAHGGGLELTVTTVSGDITVSGT